MSMIFWLCVGGLAIALGIYGLMHSRRDASRRDRRTAPGSIANPLPREWEAEVYQLLAQGDKVEAIKRVREWTGLGLREAKDYVETFPDGPPLSSLGMARSQHLWHDPSLEAEVRQLLAQGQKIEAIKQVQLQMGVGLEEAKAYVDSLDR